MATVYPGALDDFTNPTASDSLNDPTVPHATQHADANDAIEAIQATLGIDPQGTESTVDARIGALETTVDTETTGLVDRVDALETTVDTETTGLVDRVDALETSVDTETTGLLDRVDALETSVDTETTGLLDRVDVLEGIGLDPLGEDLALNIAQITADAGDELVAGEAAGEVDDSAVATYFKFTIDSVEYGIPAYAINPPE
jgi:hypothetical protein